MGFLRVQPGPVVPNSLEAVWTSRGPEVPKQWAKPNITMAKQCSPCSVRREDGGLLVIA